MHRRLAPRGRFVAPFAAAVALATAAAAGRPTPEEIASLRSAGDVRLSPDGRAIVYTVASSSFDSTATPSENDPDAGWKREQQLWLVTANGDAARQLTHGEARARSPRWSPDGQWVAWLTTHESLSMLNVLAVCAADGSGQRNAAADFERTFATFEWMPDGRSLLALVRDRTRSRLERFPFRGGAIEDLGFNRRVADGELSLSRDGTLVGCLTSTAREPGEPTVFDLGRRTERVLARTNPQIDTWDLGSQETVRWTSPEGMPLKGSLLAPSGLSKSTPPPLIVMPRGGPDDVSQGRFSAKTRFFSAHGDAVFRPNDRGGVAYGHAFYAADSGRLGEIEFLDIESGVEALVKAGRADSGRLFYGDWSWRGYLTAWTIGHTDRYRAAVVGAGVNDVVLSYALSDINHGIAALWEFEGDPWRQTADFDRASPIRFLARAITPTLILHGQSDQRVPFQQGVVLYRALRDIGCPVEFYAYPHEPHGIGEPAHVAHRLRV